MAGDNKFQDLINAPRKQLSIPLCGVFTLENVYVALPVFTPVAGSSYANFIEQMASPVCKQ